MKILHITAGMDFGGIAEAVASLSAKQIEMGCNVTIATVASEDEELVLALHEFAAGGGKIVRYTPSFPRQLFFSWQMFFGLASLIKKADVVHVHSSWTFPVWCGCRLALKHKKPLVMTPHGCFAPERLKISAVKKKLVGWLSDQRFLKKASVIQATCERESEDINLFMSSDSRGLKRLKGSKSSRGSNVAPPQGQKNSTNELTHSRTNELGQPRIAVVPNGVDLATFDAVAADREFIDAKWPECKGQRIALFLSRIHPIKGIESLIAAWCKVCASSSSSLQPSTFNLQPPTPAFSRDWILLIAGSGEDRYVAELEQQVMGAGLSESVKFVGPVFGDEKIKLMKASELFVLPTKNENFGIVVAESLACGVPVITTKGAPWQELQGNSASSLVEDSASAVENVEAHLTNELMNWRTNALPLSGWWIDHGAEPLAQALQEAMSLADAERRTMGHNGRKLVEAKYQWSAVAEQMLKAGYASF